MDIKKVSISDLFSMLLASFRLVGNHPGRFALASFFSLLILIFLVCILMAVLAATVGISQTSTLVKTMQNPSTEYLLYIYAAMIPFVLLFIPFIAGWLKLCQNSAKGETSAVSDIFLYFSFNNALKKLIYYSVISIVVYISVSYLFKLLCLAFGLDLNALETSLNPQTGGDPLAVLNLGAGFWIAYFCMLIVGMFMQIMFYLGFAHVALTANSAIDSFKAGIGGVLKNLLAIFVFSIIVFIGMLVVALLLIALVLFLSYLNKTIGLFVAIPLFMGYILFIYPLTFSFNYYFWNGILGNETENLTTEINNPEVLI